MPSKESSQFVSEFQQLKGGQPLLSLAHQEAIIFFHALQKGIHRVRRDAIIAQSLQFQGLIKFIKDLLGWFLLILVLHKKRQKHYPLEFHKELNPFANINICLWNGSTRADIRSYLNLTPIQNFYIEIRCLLIRFWKKLVRNDNTFIVGLCLYKPINLKTLMGFAKVNTHTQTNNQTIN